MPDLIKNGRVIRPWIGVQGQLVSAALKDLLRMPLTDGFLVEVVDHGSPAERLDVSGGGLDLIIGGKPFLIGGDIITEIDGSPVADQKTLAQALGSLKVGATVRLTLFHEEKTRQKDIVVAERPVRQGDPTEQATTLPVSGSLGLRGAGPPAAARLVF